jgi:general secretion pathway protein N
LTSGAKRLVIIGLMTFVVGVIVTLPARVAYRWMAPPAVQLAGIDGSVWSGSASELVVAGIYLREVEWRLRPASLLMGKLALSLEAVPSSGFLESDVSLTFGNKIIVSDLKASLPVQMFADVLHMPGLSGTASLDFPRLRVDSGLLAEARETIAVSGLLAPLIDPSPIGAYRVEFVNTETGVVASIEDTAGAFDLAGSLNINADGKYEFRGLVAANDQTPAKLRGQLRFLGSPNERGQHEVRFEGSL